MPDGSFQIQSRSLAEVETKRTRRPQRPVNLDEVRKLADMGLHLSEIAARLGFDRSWIGRITVAHGIETKRAPPRSRVDPENIRRLAPQHVAREIAMKLGCSSSRIYKVAKIHGIPLLSAHRAPVDLGALRRLATDHLPIQIAKSLGVSGDTIYATAKRLGIPLLRVETDPGFWDRNGAETERLSKINVSMAQIALRIGTSKNAVVGWLNRRKPDTPPPPRRKVEFPASGHCIFPSGDLPDMTFCGAQIEDINISKPYCKFHCGIAFIPEKRSKDEAFSDDSHASEMLNLRRLPFRV